MIVTRTPLRASFVGGGTDIPNFYKDNNYGAVVSSTINKYIYIYLDKKNNFYEKYRLNYSKTEITNDLNQIKNPIIRECIKYSNVTDRLYIGTTADFPASTGLGSSSSFCVGLLNALFAFKKEKISASKLADIAAHIEIDILQNPIGKQDHYSAAIGGINRFTFYKNNKVKINKLGDKIGKKIISNSLILWTGQFRNASTILKNQLKNADKNQEHLLKMRNEVNIFYKQLNTNCNLKKLGKILDNNWNYKKKLHNKITNKDINKYYEELNKIGSFGGKLLGAGNGGFIYFICDKKMQKKIINHKKFRNKIYKIKFESKGSVIKNII